MTRYIDSRKENPTTEEVIALVTQQAKPYPNSWYESEKSVVTSKNACLWREYQDVDPEDPDNDFSYFSCPLSRWEYLTKLI